MLGYFLDDGVTRRRGVPSPGFLHRRGIQNHPRDVEGTGICIGGHLMRAKTISAPCTELGQRHSAFNSTADIEDRIYFPARISHLSDQERHDIAWVEAIADLISPTPESDVLERPASSPGVDPEAEDSLISLAELPSASEDTATVDPDRKVKSHSILKRQ